LLDGPVELLQSGGHARERGLQAGAGGLHSRDDCNRNTRCNQTVLDSRRPRLVLPELGEVPGHDQPFPFVAALAALRFKVDGDTLRISKNAIRKFSYRGSWKAIHQES